MMALQVQSIRHLIEQRGRELAEKVFLVSPEAGFSWTCGAYRDAVLELAGALNAQNTGAGARIAIVLANGANAVVAILGVMAAGAVAVPLNPRSTPEEIERVLELSGAVLVISDVSHRESLPASVLQCDYAMHEGLETANPCQLFRLGKAPETPLPPAMPGRDDPALILYTSGTTGQPKGVVLSHGNLLSNAGYVIESHQLSEADRALCLLPVFHINGFVVTLLTPLLSGGSVIMPRRFSSGRFWQWVNQHNATWFSAVPTILSLLLSNTQAPADTGLLRFARSASAPLPVAVLEEFERRFGIPVIETYGISEAACQVTANPLPPLLRKPGSAGRPVGNELRVVDTHGQVLAPGKPGEVLIRGENVFSGYLDNPAADREALKDGWFHTGDLGYLDADGYLFLTGRKKELINRAGEKISPREVEEVIHQLPEVETVGVVGVPHHLYGEEVVAFITLRRGRALEPDQVRQLCRRHLSEFKVPREVFFVNELPKSPSGKVQRRHLIGVYHHITKQEEERA